MKINNAAFPSFKHIHAIVFDFDGVFTDNKVYVSQNSEESVACNRADGYAFDLLRKFMKIMEWYPQVYILSTEANPVVAARASKLGIEAVQSVSDKRAYLVHRHSLQENDTDLGLMYIGNDLNDLGAFHVAKYCIAPRDAHPLVLASADFVLQAAGGQGCVRELIEKILDFDSLSPDQILQYL